MVSSNASLSYEQIADAAAPSQTLFFQLYKNKDNKIAEERVKTVVKLGYKAIFLTVDALVAGNREADIRVPWVLDDLERGGPPLFEEKNEDQPVNYGGTAGGLVSSDDKDMTWEKVSRSLSELNFELIRARPYPGYGVSQVSQ